MNPIRIDQALFCPYCGRRYDSKFGCVHTFHPPRLIVIIILLVMLLAPLHWMVTLVLKGVLINDIEYLRIGHSILAAVIAVLSILGWLVKKPLLAVWFGCHQQTSRSLQVFNKPLMLCARCTGIFLGVFLFFMWRHIPLWIGILGAFPLMIDGLMQRYTRYESSHLVRLMTGLLFVPSLIYAYSLFHLGVLWLALTMGII